MATDAHKLPFYSRLRESLIVSYVDKTAIMRIAQDAGIDWADVIPEGSARAAWNDVILNARKQSRVRQLIEITAKQYPNNEGLQLALVEFNPADEALPSNNEIENLNEAIRSLDIGDETSPRINVEMLGLANSLPVQLLDLALSGQPATLNQFSSVFSGPATRNAYSDRSSFESSQQIRRFEMRQAAQRIKSDFEKMRSKIRGIEVEKQPTPPTRPKYLSGPPSQASWEYDSYRSDPSAYSARQDLINEDNKRKFEAATRRHEIAMEEYKQRQQSLPGYRFELNQLRQQVDQCEFEIARFEREFADAMQRFGREIETARSRDLVQLLATLESSAAQALGDEKNALRGYILALAVQIISSASPRWLDPSSISAANQISKDVEESADEAVRRHHCTIGRDLLSRCATIKEAGKGFENEIQSIRTSLDALPNDELTHAGTAASEMLAEEGFVPVPNYEDVVGPDDLNVAMAGLAETQKHIEEAKKSRQTLLDETTDLLAETKTARGIANLHCMRIKTGKERLKPFLDEVTYLWKILEKAEQESETSRAFTMALQEEVARRFDEFGKLISTCEQNGFIPNDGEDILSNHVSKSFIRNRDALIAQLGDLTKLEQEYDAAQKDIVNVPQRIATKNSKLLTILAIGSPVPVVNVLCLTLFLRRLFYLERWFQSALPIFRDLWRRAERISVAIFAISLMFGFLLLAFLSRVEAFLSMLDPMLKIVAPIVVATYALTAGLACWCRIQLKKMPVTASD